LMSLVVSHGSVFARVASVPAAHSTASTTVLRAA
jgi:hypothetical protein